MVEVKKAKDLNIRRNAKRYWIFAKKYKLYFFIMVAAGFLSPLVSVIERYLFKLLVDYGEAFTTGSIVSSQMTNILLLLAVVFVTVAIIKTIADWAKMHFLVKFTADMSFDLKTYFFNHIINLPHKFYTKHKSGALVARFKRGTGAIENITNFIAFNILSLIFSLILVVGSLLFFDIVSALAVVIISFVFISYSLYIVEIQKDSSIEFNNAEDKESANISDIFTNIESIKYYAKENGIKKIYGKLANKTKNTGIKYGNYFRELDAGQQLILKLGIVVLLVFPMIRFLQGDMTIGNIVFIYTTFSIMTFPLIGFVYGMRSFYRAMAHFESLYQYDEIDNEIENGNKELEIKKGEIEFDDVSFAYDSEKVIKNFNLKMKPNEKIALVGHSGSGKSTLIKLLYRLYDVDEGEILVDGEDIKDVKKKSLRSELSIVPQECVLFDDTIFNNIKFSNPDATKKEVMEAIKFAQLDEVIENFPDKEKTIVGERGIKLSGGEKQRVSLARAILADKEVLVLDEATSSLDSKTEKEIQEDLKKLLEGRTAIMIAHRLSTIMNADRIVVMDKGEIAQEGTHEELIEEGGIYEELWNLQKGGYIGE